MIILCAGMSAGLPKYVVVNLSDLDKAFNDGEKVNLDAIKEKNMLNISGREARLQLKVGNRFNKLWHMLPPLVACAPPTVCVHDHTGPSQAV